MYHEHPIKILKYSSKNIWLLIFPLFRNIKNFHISSDFFYNWIRGAWFDILIVGLIVIFGMLKWHFSEIIIGDNSIIHTNGLFIKVKTVIPYRNISSLTFERPFYLTPFRAIRFRCDTSSGIFNSADMKLTINERVYSSICKQIPNIKCNDHSNGLPKPTAISIILFSMFFSSGLSGAIYMAAFFFKGGDIARKIISEYLKKISAGTEMITGSHLIKISNAAFGIGIFFIGAWFISFIINIQRYSRYNVNMDDKCLKLSYGVITRRDYHITSVHINYTDLRQNLIMKLFRAITVHISCSGYGSGRNLPVLLPVKKEKKMSRELEAMGILSGASSEFCPKGIKNLWQYTWMPVLCALLSFPLHKIISGFIPELYELTLFAAIMAEVPSIWFIAVKIGAFITSGISLYDDKIMVRCNKLNTFHTVIADRRKLIQFEIEQTIFQRRRKACSIIFYFEGEKHKRYKVKGISVKDANDISLLLDYDSI